MKIIKLQAENIKKIKAVEITPVDNTVVISGKNGAGKSSVLDSIFYALCGNDSEHTKKPIRDGEETAKVRVDLGDYVVTRNWTSNEKSYLKVESRDGAKYPNPQTLLNSIVGKLAFDPLEFCNLSEKEQVKTLLGVVNLEDSLSKIETKRKEVYDQRTFVNRDISALEVKLIESEKLSPDLNLPVEEIKGDEIVKQIKDAQSILKVNYEIRNNLELNMKANEKLLESKKNIEAEIDKLQVRLIGLIGEIGSNTEKCVALKKQADGLIDPNIDELNNNLLGLQKINKQICVANQHRKIVATLKEVKAQAQELTAAINSFENEKLETLKTAKFPISNLSFSNTGVTYNGIPFSQCSSAERLKVSIAMAMALNPKLRVIRIMDGSLLDSSNMAVIQKMAKDHDYQIWVEIVDENRKVGIYIEDGEMKGEDKTKNYTW